MVNYMSQAKQLDNFYLEMLSTDAIKNRRITLNDTIDEVEIYKAMYYMDKIRKIDEVDGMATNKRNPITIVCNTYGGQLYECLALIGKIERFIEDGYEIITEVTGKAMSCGQFILMCGSKRRANRYATILVHQLSNWNVGNYSQMKVNYDEDARMQKFLNDLIIKKTKITQKMLDEKIKGLDWFLNSQEALELGMVDEIV